MRIDDEDGEGDGIDINSADRETSSSAAETLDDDNDARDTSEGSGRSNRRKRSERCVAEEDDDDDDDVDDARTMNGRKPKPRTAKHQQLPKDDDVRFAYDALDTKSRGFFTARDLRRVADANGFSDWRDDEVRAMFSAFKSEETKRAGIMVAADASVHRMSREEFVRVVSRVGARVTR